MDNGQSDSPTPNPSGEMATLRQWKMYVILGVSVFIIIGIIIGAVFFVRSKKKMVSNIQVPTADSTSTAPLASSTPSAPARIVNEDQDRDGLRDTEEAAQGLSNRDFDTDHDGLSDVDEMKTWKTDPTKADTDADGFDDAIEILRGYNPRGSGKL